MLCVPLLAFLGGSGGGGGGRVDKVLKGVKGTANVLVLEPEHTYPKHELTHTCPDVHGEIDGTDAVSVFQPVSSNKWLIALIPPRDCFRQSAWLLCSLSSVHGAENAACTSIITSLRHLQLHHEERML